MAPPPSVGCADRLNSGAIAYDGCMKVQHKLLAALSAVIFSTTASAWSISTEKDPMSGKTATYATLSSSNSLSLGFPYSGRNYGQLVVRRHPKYGLDVLVSIEKGQTLCRSYEPCQVAVKFDDKPPMRFSGYPPESMDSTTIFLSPESKFITNASKAKRILVQFQVYREGDQILEFNTPSPLKWPAK